jgi:carboxypeptidase Taq
MKSHLQQYGGLREPVDTIRHATGRKPTEGPLLDYLEAKFERIYRL